MRVIWILPFMVGALTLFARMPGTELFCETSRTPEGTGVGSCVEASSRSTWLLAIRDASLVTVTSLALLAVIAFGRQKIFARK